MKMLAVMWQDNCVYTERMAQQERNMRLEEGRIWNRKSKVISDYTETMRGAGFAYC
jgi:hypothetical protein